MSLTPTTPLTMRTGLHLMDSTAAERAARNAWPVEDPLIKVVFVVKREVPTRHRLSRIGQKAAGYRVGVELGVRTNADRSTR